jgi:hypothetical protein
MVALRRGVRRQADTFAASTVQKTTRKRYSSLTELGGRLPLICRLVVGGEADRGPAAVYYAGFFLSWSRSYVKNKQYGVGCTGENCDASDFAGRLHALPSGHDAPPRTVMKSWRL